MYGDQSGFPGRDGRPDDAEPTQQWETGSAPDSQPAPWETGFTPNPPFADDVKVAGAPLSGTEYSGGNDFNGNDFNGTEYMSTADGMRPPRRRVGPSGRMIKIAAVAAAVVVVGGGGIALAATGSGSSGKKDGVAAQSKVSAPAPAPLTDSQRKDAEKNRREQMAKRASRASRGDDSTPRFVAKGKPVPKASDSSSSSDSGTAGNPVPAGTAQRIAKGMLGDFGFGSNQFGCLVNMWNKESGWRTTAANPSGAYGIPQAYPGSKMASAGSDWRTNARTQIKWGLGYIKGRYGTPCGAWGYWQSHHSY